MQKMRKWVNTWLGAMVGLTAGVLFLTAVTMAQAAEPQKGKAVQQPVQGQQICPATPGGGTCKLILDCPTVKNPGQTTCEATIDCPETKEPVKTKKKSEGE